MAKKYDSQQPSFFDEVYTIVYKNGADALWDHVVFIRSEYPDLTNDEFAEIANKRYDRLDCMFDIVRIYHSTRESR